MIENRIELNEKLFIENYFPPFFSILLPELARPQYLRKCLNSIMRYADMAVEIIVHDDGSGNENQSVIFNELKHQISTLILNAGWNAGLGVAQNRCRSMASSKYLFTMNTDQQMTSSFLRNIKAALDLPYVGVVNLKHKIEPGPGVYITPEGVKIALLSTIGETILMAIRRDVWDEVGGWGVNIQTTSSDGGFVGNIFGRGYFTVAVEGTYTNEAWLSTPEKTIDRTRANPDYIESSGFTRHDNNVPKLFGMTEEKHLELCNKRREDIWYELNDGIAENKLFPTWYNHHFTRSQLDKIFIDRDVNKIDWDYAKRYGHNKWRDRVIEDFNLEG